MKRETHLFVSGILGLILIFSGAVQADRIAFQMGVDSGVYNYDEDEYIHSTHNTSQWGYRDGWEGAGIVSSVIALSGTPENINQNKGWLGFPDLFGFEAGQVPPGSVIHSATLVLQVYSTSALSVDIRLNRVLNDANQWFSGDPSWIYRSQSGSSLWVDLNDMAVDHMGDASSIETESALFSASSEENETLHIDVTASVSAWAGNRLGDDQNMGWAMSLNKDDHPLSINSPSAPEVLFRPVLLIDYVSITQPKTFGLLGFHTPEKQHSHEELGERVQMKKGEKIIM